MPNRSITWKESIDDVWAKLKDPDTYVVVQTAPAVRVALGEEFEFPIGTNVKGKMVTALKRIGFDKVLIQTQVQTLQLWKKQMNL